jgi:hypothetical protein
MASLLKADKIAATTGGAQEFTLPTADGSAGQYMKTDGSGALSFGTATAGKVLQVIQTVKSDTFTTTSTSMVDITGLSVTITPASTSNKVFVFGHINGVGLSGTNHFLARLLRDSTVIYAGDASSNRTSGMFSGYGHDNNQTQHGPILFLDSPSTTSAVTYKVQCITNTTGTVYVNRSNSDGDASVSLRGVCSIGVMEISG